MSQELICDACGHIIPECKNHIELNGLVFCNDECESEFFSEVYVL